MKIITTINDLKNQIDTWDQDGELTDDQREQAAYALRDKGNGAGFFYGEDWQKVFEATSFDDVLRWAEAE